MEPAYLSDRRRLSSTGKKGKRKMRFELQVLPKIIFLAMVAEVMGVVKKKEHYPVIYCEAVRCIAIFGRYVKSRFKRLIFDKNPNQKVRAIRDTDFLGCDMPDSIREIADNWVTFVRLPNPNYSVEIYLI